jgi:hypothetical protein
MRARRIFRRLIVVGAILIAVFVLALVLIIALEVQIDLSPIRGPIQSAATAVQVKGSFADFGFGAQPEEIAKTAIQFLTSPLHTPFRRLFEDTLPADGEAACKEAMQRRGE